MRGTAFRWGAIGLGTFVAFWLSGCGYNALQSKDEQVKSAWSEVLNQYQRRADLIPNLVNTVKGYAAQEQTVLLGVTQARAKAGSIQVSADMINDPQALAKFQAAQGELSGALSRLIGLRGEHGGGHSAEELKFIVESSRHAGHLETFEEEAISKLLELKEVPEMEHPFDSVKQVFERLENLGHEA